MNDTQHIDGTKKKIVNILFKYLQKDGVVLGDLCAQELANVEST